jgi:hypothetical protein
MSIGLVFWILMLLALLSWVGAWMNVDPRIGHVSGLLLWVLLALLGWHDFGAMIHS